MSLSETKQMYQHMFKNIIYKKTVNRKKKAKIEEEGKWQKAVMNVEPKCRPFIWGKKRKLQAAVQSRIFL